MKKQWFLVLAGLIIIGLSFSGCSTFTKLFGRGPANQSKVAEVGDLAEVPDVYIPPRQNPADRMAEVVLEKGGVTALPARPLLPEAERLPPPVYAISGVKGQDIYEDNPWEVVDIWIYLPKNEQFVKGLLEGADVSSWIPKLPAGLEARAHRVRKGATRMSIYISGKPEKTGRDYISVLVPGEYLKGGSPFDTYSPTEEDSIKAWEEQQTASEEK